MDGKHDGPRRVDRIEPVTSTLRCPLCQDQVRLEVPTPWVACAGCLARHHGSCWADVRRCGACGHGVRLRPDDRRRPWLRLLASAVLGSLLTALVLKVAMLRETIVIDDGQFFDPFVPEVPEAPVAVAPPPEPARRAVDLSHVRVGQRWVYEMQNNMQQHWTVREVGADFVKYELRMFMSGSPLGDPTMQEWRHGAPSWTLDTADPDPTRERLTVSGIEFDCQVSVSSGYRSWTPMTPGSAMPTFPMILKAIQLSDEAVVMSLIRIEAPRDVAPRGDGGTTSRGYRLCGDRTEVDDGSGTWVPYNPMVHGDLPD